MTTAQYLTLQDDGCPHCPHDLPDYGSGVPTSVYGRVIHVRLSKAAADALRVHDLEIRRPNPPEQPRAWRRES